MTRLAKAMSAFNFGRSGCADGRDAVALATRGASLDAEGSGARNNARANPRLGLGLLLGMLALTLFAAPSASAAPKANLDDFGSPNGSEGGQLSFARGLAVNQTGNGGLAGSVYVAEGAANHRISQFDKDGNFIRTWGYDVIKAGEPNDNGTGFEICDVTDGNEEADCKAGVSGVGAGQLSNPGGIAIDQATGFLYVTSGTNRRVDVFAGTGAFAGAFGWGVDTGATALEVCTTASVCQAAAAAGGAAGNFQNLNASGPSIDPTGAPGTLYVPDVGNARVSEFSTTIAAGILSSATFVKAFGWDVDPAGGTELETCTAITGCKQGTSGAGAGQFGPLNNGSPTSSAVDSTGAVYVASGPMIAGACSPATPCRIQKFAPGAGSATDFGPTSEPGQLVFTSGASNTVAGLGVAVDPDNDHVFVLIKRSTTTYQLNEYDSDGVFIDTHPSGSSLPGSNINLGVGIGVGLEERIYANLGGPSAGQVFVLGPVPEPLVHMVPPVEDITGTSATVNGEITIEPPGGPGFEATYNFELSTNGSDWTVLPGGVSGSAADSYPVSVALDDLQPNTQYLVRLSATAGTKVISEMLAFNTLQEAPRVALTYTEEVTGTSANLGAHVDPQGLKASYYFEWGPTDAYGSRVPAFARQLGSGNDPVVALDEIAGLQPAATYHFRVVAVNAQGTTFGPDREFETLNACGLTDDRCYELVSPADKGPVGAAGDTAILGFNLQFQAHVDRPAIAYTMAYGLPDAPSGSEVFYEGVRDSSGWTSKDLNPPTVDVPVGTGTSSPTTRLGLSANLGCEVFASTQPLSSDAPAATFENGQSVLYGRNASGEYRAITDQVATNNSLRAALGEYELAGLANTPGQECSRVYFNTDLQYPGIVGAGVDRLYEWEDGVLRNAGEVPGPSGPVAVEAVPGAGERNFSNAVSFDGSQIVFSATRQASGLAAEVGSRAVFVRTDGATATDASLSQTAVPNNGPSRYELASKDGAEVFFTARYGLAANGSSAGATSCAANSTGANGIGCDLYRYSVATGELVDLSVPGDGSNGAGASVAGVLGASDDGSHVYFAARGQLVPGEGNTESENLSAQTYSVYASDEGSLEFIGQLGSLASGASTALSTKRIEPIWTSRVTPSGSHLLFQSRASVTEHDSEGKVEAYLYDADAGSVECVSCRRDDQASVAGELFNPLLLNSLDANRLAPLASLTSDGSKVFFISPNRLAVGATEGRPNLYQWDRGQITFIASSAPSTARELRFAGASANGDELYFATVDQLTWQDTDGKLDIYNARVGGGIPEPPAPPTPCNPLTESSCQGSDVSAGPGAAAIAASAQFSGAGNVKHGSAARCNKRQVRRGNRCISKRVLANRACAKRKGKAKRRCVANQMRRLNRIQQRQNRAANTDRRAGK